MINYDRVYLGHATHKQHRRLRLVKQRKSQLYGDLKTIQQTLHICLFYFYTLHCDVCACVRACAVCKPECKPEWVQCVCVCVCVCVRVRACVSACVCVCALM